MLIRQLTEKHLFSFSILGTDSFRQLTDRNDKANKSIGIKKATVKSLFL
jgi:hypothetical protein